MNNQKLASTFKALSHPHRLAIFRCLAKCCESDRCDLDECARPCMGELGKGLKVSQSTLSHHLRELIRAGLVRTCKSGQSTMCWVTETTLDSLAQFFLKAKGA